jgi:hypothetical protein
MHSWGYINMLARFLMVGLVFLPSCSLLRFFQENPLQIKATIEGEIKGHHIKCEKTLKLGDGKWGLMCGIDNGVDIKYRVRPIANDRTQIEFLVGKSKEGREKIIATPAVVVKRTEIARNVTTTDNSYITVVAERIP